MAGDLEYISKYRILGRLGAGAMGVVYRAYDPLLKRVVAIKTMAESITSDDKLRARFKREAEAIAQLNHENIIAVYDMGEVSNRLYLVMEFLQGQDLRSLIATSAGLKIEDKLNIMIQICSGLAHAHSKNVVHRDVKPSNIFITSQGLIKILDFGLARLEASDLTGSGEGLGTPSYMAPEQLQAGKATGRSDVFSAGVVFYELLSGTRAFQAEDINAVLMKVLRYNPPALRQVDPSLPEELSGLIQKAMIKDPEARWPDMATMRDSLAGISGTLAQRRRSLQKEISDVCTRFRELSSQDPAGLEDRQATFDQIRDQVLGSTVGPSPALSAATEKPTATLSYTDLVGFKTLADAEYEKAVATASRRKASMETAPDAALEATRSEMQFRTEITGAVSPAEPATQIQSGEPLAATASELTSKEQEKARRQNEKLEAKKKRLDQRVPGFLSIFIDRAAIGMIGHPIPMRFLTGGAAAFAITVTLLILIVGMDGLLYLNAETRRAMSLARDGKYEEAGPALASLLTRYRGNRSLLRLQEQSSSGAEQVHQFDRALAENDDFKAEQALNRLRQINASDVNLAAYRSRFMDQVQAAYQDDFHDLKGWIAPSDWSIWNQPGDKRLIVREGFGLIRGRRYGDFDADFNLTFGDRDSASWVMRARNDQNYYLLELHGPKADPPNSILAWKVVDGRRVSLKPPAAVGKDLSLAGDQLSIYIRARGSTIQHFIASALAPENDDPKGLITITDGVLQQGGFGFLGYDKNGFSVRALKIGSTAAQK
jgi:serine/threonine protein kinase